VLQTQSNGIHIQNVILGRPAGHVDFDGLNNRRKNLYLTTNAAHAAHRRKCRTYGGNPTTSEFKGVSWSKRKHQWIAGISVGRIRRRLFFVSEIDAAVAYNEWAKEIHGPHAALNAVEG
jgi:hypothetical protein